MEKLTRRPGEPRQSHITRLKQDAQHVQGVRYNPPNPHPQAGVPEVSRHLQTFKFQVVDGANIKLPAFQSPDDPPVGVRNQENTQQAIQGAFEQATGYLQFVNDQIQPLRGRLNIPDGQDIFSYGLDQIDFNAIRMEKKWSQAEHEDFQTLCHALEQLRDYHYWHGFMAQCERVSTFIEKSSNEFHAFLADRNSKPVGIQDLPDWSRLNELQRLNALINHWSDVREELIDHMKSFHGTVQADSNQRIAASIQHAIHELEKDTAWINRLSNLTDREKTEVIQRAGRFAIFQSGPENPGSSTVLQEESIYVAPGKAAIRLPVAGGDLASRSEDTGYFAGLNMDVPGKSVATLSPDLAATKSTFDFFGPALTKDASAINQNLPFIEFIPRDTDASAGGDNTLLMAKSFLKSAKELLVSLAKDNDGKLHSLPLIGKIEDAVAKIGTDVAAGREVEKALLYSAILALVSYAAVRIWTMVTLYSAPIHTSQGSMASKIVGTSLFVGEFFVRIPSALMFQQILLQGYEEDYTPAATEDEIVAATGRNAPPLVYQFYIVGENQCRKNHFWSVLLASTFGSYNTVFAASHRGGGWKAMQGEERRIQLEAWQRESTETLKFADQNRNDVKHTWQKFEGYLSHFANASFLEGRDPSYYGKNEYNPDVHRAIYSDFEFPEDDHLSTGEQIDKGVENMPFVGRKKEKHPVLADEVVQLKKLALLGATQRNRMYIHHDSVAQMQILLEKTSDGEFGLASLYERIAARMGEHEANHRREAANVFARSEPDGAQRLEIAEQFGAQRRLFEKMAKDVRVRAEMLANRMTEILNMRNNAPDQRIQELHKDFMLFLDHVRERMDWFHNAFNFKIDTDEPNEYDWVNPADLVKQQKEVLHRLDEATRQGSPLPNAAPNGVPDRVWQCVKDHGNDVKTFIRALPGDAVAQGWTKAGLESLQTHLEAAPGYNHLLPVIQLLIECFNQRYPQGDITEIQQTANRIDIIAAKIEAVQQLENQKSVEIKQYRDQLLTRELKKSRREALRTAMHAAQAEVDKAHNALVKDIRDIMKTQLGDIPAARPEKRLHFNRVLASMSQASLVGRYFQIHRKELANRQLSRVDFMTGFVQNKYELAQSVPLQLFLNNPNNRQMISAIEQAHHFLHKHDANIYDGDFPRLSRALDIVVSIVIHNLNASGDLVLSKGKRRDIDRVLRRFSYLAQAGLANKSAPQLTIDSAVRRILKIVYDGPSFSTFLRRLVALRSSSGRLVKEAHLADNARAFTQGSRQRIPIVDTAAFMDINNQVKADRDSRKLRNQDSNLGLKAKLNPSVQTLLGLELRTLLAQYANDDVNVKKQAETQLKQLHTALVGAMLHSGNQKVADSFQTVANLVDYLKKIQSIHDVKNNDAQPAHVRDNATRFTVEDAISVITAKYMAHTSHRLASKPDGQSHRYAHFQGIYFILRNPLENRQYFLDYEQMKSFVQEFTGAFTGEAEQAFGDLFDQLFTDCTNQAKGGKVADDLKARWNEVFSACGLSKLFPEPPEVIFRDQFRYVMSHDKDYFVYSIDPKTLQPIDPSHTLLPRMMFYERKGEINVSVIQGAQYYSAEDTPDNSQPTQIGGKNDQNVWYGSREYSSNAEELAARQMRDFMDRSYVLNQSAALSANIVKQLQRPSLDATDEQGMHERHAFLHQIRQLFLVIYNLRESGSDELAQLWNEFKMAFLHLQKRIQSEYPGQFIEPISLDDLEKVLAGTQDEAVINKFANENVFKAIQSLAVMVTHFLDSHKIHTGMSTGKSRMGTFFNCGTNRMEVEIKTRLANRAVLIRDKNDENISQLRYVRGKWVLAHIRRGKRDDHISPPFSIRPTDKVRIKQLLHLYLREPDSANGSGHPLFDELNGDRLVQGNWTGMQLKGRWRSAHAFSYYRIVDRDGQFKPYTIHAKNGRLIIMKHQSLKAFEEQLGVEFKKSNVVNIDRFVKEESAYKVIWQYHGLSSRLIKYCDDFGLAEGKNFVLANMTEIDTYRHHWWPGRRKQWQKLQKEFVSMVDRTNKSEAEKEAFRAELVMIWNDPANLGVIVKDYTDEGEVFTDWIPGGKGDRIVASIDHKTAKMEKMSATIGMMDQTLGDLRTAITRAKNQHVRIIKSTPSELTRSANLNSNELLNASTDLFADISVKSLGNTVKIRDSKTNMVLAELFLNQSQSGWALNTYIYKDGQYVPSLTRQRQSLDFAQASVAVGQSLQYVLDTIKSTDTQVYYEYNPKDEFKHKNIQPKPFLLYDIAFDEKTKAYTIYRFDENGNRVKEAPVKELTREKLLEIRQAMGLAGCTFEYDTDEFNSDMFHTIWDTVDGDSHAMRQRTIRLGEGEKEVSISGDGKGGVTLDISISIGASAGDRDVLGKRRGLVGDNSDPDKFKQRVLGPLTRFKGCEVQFINEDNPDIPEATMSIDHDGKCRKKLIRVDENGKIEVQSEDAEEVSVDMLQGGRYRIVISGIQDRSAVEEFLGERFKKDPVAVKITRARTQLSSVLNSVADLTGSANIDFKSVDGTRQANLVIRPTGYEIRFSGSDDPVVFVSREQAIAALDHFFESVQGDVVMDANLRLTEIAAKYIRANGHEEKLSAPIQCMPDSKITEDAYSTLKGLPNGFVTRAYAVKTAAGLGPGGVVEFAGQLWRWANGGFNSFYDVKDLQHNPGYVMSNQYFHLLAARWWYQHSSTDQHFNWVPFVTALGLTLGGDAVINPVSFNFMFPIIALMNVAITFYSYWLDAKARGNTMSELFNKEYLLRLMAPSFINAWEAFKLGKQSDFKITNIGGDRDRMPYQYGQKIEEPLYLNATAMILIAVWLATSGVGAIAGDASVVNILNTFGTMTIGLWAAFNLFMQEEAIRKMIGWSDYLSDKHLAVKMHAHADKIESKARLIKKLQRGLFYSKTQNSVARKTEQTGLLVFRLLRSLYDLVVHPEYKAGALSGSAVFGLEDLAGHVLEAENLRKLNGLNDDTIYEMEIKFSAIVSDVKHAIGELAYIMLLGPKSHPSAQTTRHENPKTHSAEDVSRIVNVLIRVSNSIGHHGIARALYLAYSGQDIPADIRKQMDEELKSPKAILVSQDMDRLLVFLKNSVCTPEMADTVSKSELTAIFGNDFMSQALIRNKLSWVGITPNTAANAEFNISPNFLTHSTQYNIDQAYYAIVAPQIKKIMVGDNGQSGWVGNAQLMNQYKTAGVLPADFPDQQLAVIFNINRDGVFPLSDANLIAQVRTLCDYFKLNPATILTQANGVDQMDLDGLDRLQFRVAQALAQPNSKIPHLERAINGNRNFSPENRQAILLELQRLDLNRTASAVYEKVASILGQDYVSQADCATISGLLGMVMMPRQHQAVMAKLNAIIENSPGLKMLQQLRQLVQKKADFDYIFARRDISKNGLANSRSNQLDRLIAYGESCEAAGMHDEALKAFSSAQNMISHSKKSRTGWLFTKKRTLRDEEGRSTSTQLKTTKRSQHYSRLVNLERQVRTAILRCAAAKAAVIQKAGPKDASVFTAPFSDEWSPEAKAFLNAYQQTPDLNDPTVGAAKDTWDRNEITPIWQQIFDQGTYAQWMPIILTQFRVPQPYIFNGIDALITHLRTVSPKTVAYVLNEGYWDGNNYQPWPEPIKQWIQTIAPMTGLFRIDNANRRTMLQDQLLACAHSAQNQGVNSPAVRAYLIEVKETLLRLKVQLQPRAFTTLLHALANEGEADAAGVKSVNFNNLNDDAESQKLYQALLALKPATIDALKAGIQVRPDRAKKMTDAGIAFIQGPLQNHQDSVQHSDIHEVFGLLQPIVAYHAQTAAYQAKCGQDLIESAMSLDSDGPDTDPRATVFWDLLECRLTQFLGDNGIQQADWQAVFTQVKPGVRLAVDDFKNALLHAHPQKIDRIQKNGVTLQGGRFIAPSAQLQEVLGLMRVFATYGSLEQVGRAKGTANMKRAAVKDRNIALYNIAKLRLNRYEQSGNISDLVIAHQSISRLSRLTEQMGALRLDIESALELAVLDHQVALAHQNKQGQTPESQYNTQQAYKAKTQALSVLFQYLGLSEDDINADDFQGFPDNTQLRHALTTMHLRGMFEMLGKATTGWPAGAPGADSPVVQGLSKFKIRYPDEKAAGWFLTYRVYNRSFLKINVQEIKKAIVNSAKAQNIILTADQKIDIENYLLNIQGVLNTLYRQNPDYCKKLILAMVYRDAADDDTFLSAMTDWSRNPDNDFPALLQDDRYWEIVKNNQIKAEDALNYFENQAAPLPGHLPQDDSEKEVQQSIDPYVGALEGVIRSMGLVTERGFVLDSERVQSRRKQVLEQYVLSSDELLRPENDTRYKATVAYSAWDYAFRAVDHVLPGVGRNLDMGTANGLFDRILPFGVGNLSDRMPNKPWERNQDILIDVLQSMILHIFEMADRYEAIETNLPAGQARDQAAAVKHRYLQEGEQWLGFLSLDDASARRDYNLSKFKKGESANASIVRVGGLILQWMGALNDVETTYWTHKLAQVRARLGDIRGAVQAGRTAKFPLGELGSGDKSEVAGEKVVPSQIRAQNAQDLRGYELQQAIDRANQAELTARRTEAIQDIKTILLAERRKWEVRLRPDLPKNNKQNQEIRNRIHMLDANLALIEQKLLGNSRDAQFQFMPDEPGVLSVDMNELDIRVLNPVSDLYVRAEIASLSHANWTDPNTKLRAQNLGQQLWREAGQNPSYDKLSRLTEWVMITANKGDQTPDNQEAIRGYLWELNFAPYRAYLRDQALVKLQGIKSKLGEAHILRGAAIKAEQEMEDIQALGGDIQTAQTHHRQSVLKVAQVVQDILSQVNAFKDPNLNAEDIVEIIKIQRDVTQMMRYVIASDFRLVPQDSLIACMTNIEYFTTEGQAQFVNGNFQSIEAQFEFVRWANDVQVLRAEYRAVSLFFNRVRTIKVNTVPFSDECIGQLLDALRNDAPIQTILSTWVLSVNGQDDPDAVRDLEPMIRARFVQSKDRARNELEQRLAQHTNPDDQVAFEQRVVKLTQSAELGPKNARSIWMNQINSLIEYYESSGNWDRVLILTGLLTRQAAPNTGSLPTWLMGTFETWASHLNGGASQTKSEVEFRAEQEWQFSYVRALVKTGTLTAASEGVAHQLAALHAKLLRAKSEKNYGLQTQLRAYILRYQTLMTSISEAAAQIIDHPAIRAQMMVRVPLDAPRDPRVALPTERGASSLVQMQANDQSPIERVRGYVSLRMVNNGEETSAIENNAEMTVRHLPNRLPFTDLLRQYPADVPPGKISLEGYLVFDASIVENSRYAQAIAKLNGGEDWIWKNGNEAIINFKGRSLNNIFKDLFEDDDVNWHQDRVFLQSIANSAHFVHDLDSNDAAPISFKMFETGVKQSPNHGLTDAQIEYAYSILAQSNSTANIIEQAMKLMNGRYVPEATIREIWGIAEPWDPGIWQDPDQHSLLKELFTQEQIIVGNQVQYLYRWNSAFSEDDDGHEGIQVNHLEALKKVVSGHVDGPSSRSAWKVNDAILGKTPHISENTKRMLFDLFNEASSLDQSALDVLQKMYDDLGEAPGSAITGNTNYRQFKIMGSRIAESLGQELKEMWHNFNFSNFILSAVKIVAFLMLLNFLFTYQWAGVGTSIFQLIGNASGAQIITGMSLLAVPWIFAGLVGCAIYIKGKSMYEEHQNEKRKARLRTYYGDAAPFDPLNTGTKLSGNLRNRF